MYFNNCGKEIDDKAVVCIHCGVATVNSTLQQAQDTANEKPNTGLMVVLFFIPIAGFIIGSVEKGNGKVKAGKAYIKMGCISLLLSFIFGIICYFAAIAATKNAIDEAYEEADRAVSKYYDDTYEFASSYADLFN